VAPREIEIDPFRELFIVDPSVVLDVRASSAANGPWSFRWLIEQMVPPGTDPSAFVEAWLRSLRTTSLNGFALEDRAGVEEFLGGGPRAWPRTSSGRLDLSRAPLRLLAIVNRIDLSEYGNGEARFVFGLVDPSAGAPDRMTVAFEYRLAPLGTANDLAEWARRWHELSEHPFGEAYNAALEALTRAFTSRGADPSGVAGNALSQLRMNEAAFGELWQLREWQLDRDARGVFLRPAELPQTPDQSLNGSEELARFLLEHDAEVRAGRHVIPLAMRGGASLQVGAWAFRRHAAIDEPLRHAFARNTCNGCHSSETFSANGFFHVSPLGASSLATDGTERISPFVKETELPRRAAHLATLLGGGLRGPAPAPEPAPPRYTVTAIPAGEDSAPIALDAQGRVLGNSERGPWIWDGALRMLFPGDSNANRYFAFGFNSRGDVVGSVTQPDGTRRGFLLRSGVVEVIGTLGGSYSSAHAIDSFGRVAGDSTSSDGSHRSFLFEAGALRNLGTLGGNETLAFAINSQGQVTGQSQTADGALQPYVFDGTGLRGLGSLGGRFGRGHAINDKGQVAGLSELVPGDPKIHAFFWDGSWLRDLGTLPGLPWTSATGLNNSGEIVGNVYDKPDYKGDEYVTYAFVYRDGRMWNLNQVIAPSPFTLLVALGINDKGQILCTDGQSGAQRSHGFLLDPVSE
jgi:probable HAF family extracellular repeat protein